MRNFANGSIDRPYRQKKINRQNVALQTRQVSTISGTLSVCEIVLLNKQFTHEHNGSVAL